ncbi:hypothetical protein BO79DRAFT_209826 [Aspergillus costaricaensis CBS 115574]|uniref:Uncharacterized protein n=1 Tax=Aspergillus costaricaensis CBS 115574 TaxID=1448317 RepID=A0ACD1ICH0_9EURO|nr:hypothetical protein BO79DRAFT_209826 [Aspergillus costaricaensis CBS 115574]RAK87433.1 hypothetical protein BO79DRAFT_209826 [Aspergillus costaricaensis CBS 115574]
MTMSRAISLESCPDISRNLSGANGARFTPGVLGSPPATERNPPRWRRPGLIGMQSFWSGRD